MNMNSTFSELNTPPDNPSASDGRVHLNTALLKKLRLERGLSQAKLAEQARDNRLPLSIASIKRAELGEPVIYRTAVQLASLFQVAVHDLLTAASPSWNLGSHRHLAGQSAVQMVGRESELHQVQFALKHTLQTQQGRLLYVRGIAGIGKSCLFNQTGLMAREMGYSTSPCHVPSPLLSDNKHLLSLLTQALLRDEDEQSPESLQERIEQLQLDPSLRGQISSLLGLPLSEEAQQLQASMTHGVRRDKQRQAIWRVVEQQTRNGPMVVMIEDLHWADADSIQTLSLIVYETREMPVVWVITSRNEQDPLESRIRPFLANYPIHIIELAPLSQQEAQALAQHVLPDNPVRRQACIDQAQGNPLFLTQLLLSEDAVGLPQTLVDLIRLKLSLLDESDREAIQIAAALQGEFSLSQLQVLLRKPHYSACTLVQHRLLRHCANDHFSFVHDLIMRGIDAQTDEDLRHHYHARIAHDYANRDARLHAIHLTKAKKSEAPDALLVAIKACCASYQFGEALELLRAYESIDFAPQTPYSFHLWNGRVLTATGNSQAALEHQENALALAQGLDQALPVVVELARTLNVLDQLAREEELLIEYIPLAEAAQMDCALSQLLYLRGNLYFPKGDYKRSRELHLAARQIAQRAHDVRTEALALSGLGDSYYAQGWMHKATDIFRVCLTLCEAHGLADVEASNRFMLATTRLYLNETAPALHDALASAKLGARVGNLRAEIVSRLTAGWLYSAMGQVDQAQQQYDSALQIAHNISAHRFVPFLLEGLAKCHHIAGHATQATDTIRQAWSLVEEQKLHRFIGPWVLGTRAIIERDESLRTQAIDTGLQIIQTGSVAHNHYRFYVSAGEAAVQSRNTALASQMADMLESFTLDQPCAWADHHIALLRLHVRLLHKTNAQDEEKLRALILQGEQAGLSFVAPYLHGHLN